MDKVFSFSVDLEKRYPMQISKVYINTLDHNSVVFDADVTIDGVSAIEEGVTAKIAVLKPSRSVAYQNVDIVGGRIYLTLNKELYAEKGNHTAEFILTTADGKKLISAPFVYSTSRGILSNEAVEREGWWDDIYYLESRLNDLNYDIDSALLGIEEATQEARTQAQHAKDQGDYAQSTAQATELAITKTEEATSEAKQATQEALDSSQKAESSAAQADIATSNAGVATQEASNAADQANAAKAEADVATSNANTAANLANVAAQEANQAAVNSQQATQEANTAATNANNATQAAQTATSQAQSATTSATTQAQYAKEQGDYAKAQGDLAKGAVAGVIPNATQSASGLMSATDKTKLDNGQQWKLTENSGNPVVPAQNTDFSTPMKTGFNFYSTDVGHTGRPLGGGGGYWNVLNFGYDAQLWGSMYRDKLYYRRRSEGPAVLSDFVEIINSRELGNVLLGNKNWLTPTTNFINKTSGSTTTNPHIAREVKSATLLPPGSGTEVASYTNLQTQNGVSHVVSTNVNGEQAQLLSEFDLIAYVERTYGAIPRATTAEKVTWLQSVLNSMTIRAVASGSSPNGNKVSLTWYLPNNSQALPKNEWRTPQASVSTSSNLVMMSRVLAEQSANYHGNPDNAVDENGKAHFIIYADPSNGTTPSVVNVDYVELQIELNTSVWDGMPDNWLSATFQNAWGGTLQYKQIGNLLVVRGRVSGGTINLPVTTLPSAYRPRVATVRTAQGTATGSSRVTVATSGTITIEAAVSGATGYDIDFIIPL